MLFMSQHLPHLPNFFVSSSSSLMFGFSTPKVLISICTPGVPNTTFTPGVSNPNPEVSAPLVLSLDYSMVILLRSSKLRSLSSCALMVENSSNNLITESGIGTSLNWLRVMRLPVCRQRKL